MTCAFILNNLFPSLEAPVWLHVLYFHYAQMIHYLVPLLKESSTHLSLTVLGNEYFKKFTILNSKKEAATFPLVPLLSRMLGLMAFILETLFLSTWCYIAFVIKNQFIIYIQDFWLSIYISTYIQEIKLKISTVVLSLHYRLK